MVAASLLFIGGIFLINCAEFNKFKFERQDVSLDILLRHCIKKEISIFPGKCCL